MQPIIENESPFMKNLLLLLWSLLAASAGLAQAAVKIEHWQTAAGARVYFVASPALPMLDVRVDFSAGAAFDPPGKAGLAGLTKGLLDAGVQLDGVELGEEQIAERLADIAAHLGAAADLDRASLSLRTLTAPPQREAALALMRAMLSSPTFPEAVLVREKARSIAAIQEADTRPDSLGDKRFRAAIYPGHPYGVSATALSVASITRADLVDFWRKHFVASRAVVSIIGDVTRAQAEQIAARLTDALPQPAADAVAGSAALPAVTLPQRQMIRLPHPATQSHVSMGLPMLKRGDPDLYPLLVGNYILGGGGFVSRLMKEVREQRGYVYGIHSSFDPLRLEGPFEINLQTRRAQADEAIQVVEATLGRFLKEGPTVEEVRAAKRNLIDGLALRLDSNAKILGYLAVIGFYGLPLNYLDDYPRQIEAVSATQVRDVFARRLRPEHTVTVVVAAD
jgi:zinc protease